MMLATEEGVTEVEDRIGTVTILITKDNE